MKITVLNGSPKGLTSVTMQYVHYIQKTFPEHELNIINIALKIRRIEKDAAVFQKILDDIRFADGVLWASPVYFMLIPSNYKRFIELISENGAAAVFRDKYAAFLSTSIHFLDHTAHNYMHAICDDLNMRYVGSFSADMYDLQKKRGRKQLILFAENFLDKIKSNTLPAKGYLPVIRRDFEYAPGDVRAKVDTGNRKVLIVTDAKAEQTNLVRMVERFKASFLSDIEVVNLRDIDIKGGCLGCIQCGYDNRCAYEGKDGYVEFYNTKIKAADILVWAGKITDRYLSSTWKLFFDRSFFNGHAPSLKGKQIAYIISGPLIQVPNLRQIMEAYVEMQHANLGGIATDEYGDSIQIDGLLQNLAAQVVQYADSNYIRPPTFLGVGGGKLFRDEIWGRLRFPFRADYVAFKKLNAYNFPQKNYKMRFQNGIMLLLSKLPAFRKEVNKRIKKEMIKPIEKETWDS